MNFKKIAFVGGGRIVRILLKRLSEQVHNQITFSVSEPGEVAAQEFV